MEVSATRAPPEILPRLGPDEHVPVPGNLTFDEVIQALNPLHHLPVVGTIYRAATGETVNPALRVLGGALLGGPIGALSSAVFAALEQFSPTPSAPAPATPPTALASARGPHRHG
ncbi:hypothetical protein [Falsiroseomonas tokyonensis]|uniref:Uncharacterized protein n=1 Tax=Falsiroseomonas tokyonensis TaxID=430521 RepID=A0ABV7BND4_9PROT|nr:hypothetical protein [Falsiroseomonas tokyonensis]MBU8537106.1 hypothetical protein [Falsiroseomonas tokyonensis]